MHSQIQSFLRAAIAGRPGAMRVGPFLVGFDEHDDTPFRNYAVPDDGARPTDSDVEALIHAFAARHRLPRLEYLPAVAPTVEQRLREHGFSEEGRLAVMTATAVTMARAATSDPDGVIVGLAASWEGLTAAAGVQNAAYGAPVPTGHDVRRLVELCAAGGKVALARTADLEAVGSGLVTAPQNAVAELAAVGVLEPWRRRGIAGAVTCALVEAAFAGGSTMIVLMAAYAEQRIYARAGFRSVSKIVFLGRPRAGEIAAVAV